MNKMSLLFGVVLCGSTFASEIKTDPASPFKDRTVPEMVPSDSPEYIAKTGGHITNGASVDPETGERIFDMEPLIIRPFQFQEERMFKEVKKRITHDFVTTESVMKNMKQESAVSEILNGFILADFLPDDTPLFGFSSAEIAEMYRNEARLENALEVFEDCYPDDKYQSKDLRQEKFELMKLKRGAVDWHRWSDE